MEGNRVLAENTIKHKTRITFDFNRFNFSKLNVGDEGTMNIKGTISMERLEGDEAIKTLKILSAKLEGRKK